MTGVPEAVVVDLEQAATREVFDAVLKSAYAAGWSLRELGSIVGVSGESIRLRIRRQVPASLLRSYPSPPNSPTMAAFGAAKVRNRRILGLKRDSPVMRIPVSDLTELARLHSLVTEVRGWTPLDDPARLAIPEFGALLDRLISEFEIPQTHLERAIGLKNAALNAWRRSHGYVPQTPSQKSYRGVVVDHAERASGAHRSRYAVGGECRKGHALTEANLRSNGAAGNICGTCVSDRARDRYQRSSAPSAPKAVLS